MYKRQDVIPAPPPRIRIPQPREFQAIRPGDRPRQVWVLGASLGGPAAVKLFLDCLPANLPVAFVLAQHIDGSFLDTLCGVLGRDNPILCKIGVDGEALRHGELAIVPVEYAVRFRHDGRIQSTGETWEGPYAPSIDQVIQHVGEGFGNACGAILFSGMGNDGAIAARVANDQTGRGDYRPLVNVIGLWLLEETLKEFKARPQKAAEWTKLINAARALPASEHLLDVTDSAFGNPTSMRRAIDQQLKRRRLKLPRDLAAYTRLICDSLGQGHADVIANLTKLSGRTFKRIIMVGGGAQNALLCQATANAAGLPVLSCQLEGSAVGNMANQLIALKAVKDLPEFRRHLTKQLKSKTYQPGTG